MKNRSVIVLLFLFEILFHHSVFAQTLNPAMDDALRPRLLFKGSNVMVFSGSAGGRTDLKLKMGTLPGLFTTAAVPFPGAALYLRPDALSLPIGAIYAVLTNSDSTSLAGIQAQAAINSNIVVSNTIGFIIESPNSATALAPIGVETNSAPLFRWTSVPGVPAYQLILSKTPFQVTKDPVSGELSVVGANIIWRYSTTATSAVYGSTNANSSLSLGTAPPLIPGNEYNYTILNVYDPDGNSAYTSDVFGGVVSFKFTAPTTIQAPTLRSPAENATFYADNIITFSWDPVPNANLYTFYLFQRVTTTSGAKQEFDLPLWSSTLTSTIIDYQAKGSLPRGKYLWYVSVSDAAGNGNASKAVLFNYAIDMGKIRLQAVPTIGSGNLVGLEIRARAIKDGASPTNPFIIGNDRIINDSLVAGTYQFSGSKVGYADTTITVVIPLTPLNGSSVDVIVPLRALPATISGTVLDQASLPVSGATVQLVNLLTASQQSAQTSSAGQFSISTEGGTYSVQATKPGYIPSSSVAITVAVGDHKVLPAALSIRADQATVSGTIVNDVGTPVSMATVTASATTAIGLQTQTVITNASGNYSFNNATTLSSGNWSIAASKDGFVSAAARQITLSLGESRQLENIVLLPKANTINGSVTELIVTNGSSGNIPLKDVVVTARPLAGADITTTTSLTGQFTLSLKQGTYHIQASQDNYGIAPGSQSGYDVTVSVGQTVTGINFSLQANPSSVSGSVSLSDGTSVSGAAISSSGGTSALSSANGSYTVSLPAGSFTLSVSKDGYGAPPPIAVSVAAGQNLRGVNFQLSPNAAVISGAVQSAGEAVAGALLVALNTTSGDSLSSMASSTGLFSLSVQPGTWKVTASKAGFISAASTVTVGPGQRSGANVFVLVANTTQINGIVSDGSATIRNASVAIEEAGNPSNAVATTSKDDGSFTSTVTAGKSYTVTVSSIGYVTKSAATGVLAAGKSTALSFTLAIAPSSVSGVVINNFSLPLYPAKVYVQSQTYRLLDSTTTDNTGAYRIGLSAGTFTIISRLPGYIADSVSVTPTIGQSLSGINLRLTENFAVISGTITGRSIPLANALVNVSGNNGGATVTSGSDGSFLLSRLVGGVYSIKVTRDTYGDTTLSATLSGGQSRQFVIDLIALDGKINGTIKSLIGQPIAGATVFIRNTTGKAYTTVSGGDGTYTQVSLPSGKYRINAAKSGYSSVKIDSVVLTSTSLTGTSVIADFAPNTLRVKGRITDAATASGVSGITVAVSGTIGSGSALTNTSGDYLIDNLALSSYTLLASKSGYTTVSRTISPVASDTLLTTDIQLAVNNGTISGTVKNDAGAPLSFSVSLKATSRTATSAATADANGNFTFSNISRDSTTVTTDFFREGYDNVATLVAFPTGQSSVTGVALVVVPHTSEIDGSAGVADALLQLTEATGKISSRLVNSRPDKSYSFTLLPSGNYTLKPAKDGFSFTPATQSIILASSQIATLASFSAVADTGSILVRVTEQTTNAGMAGVTVSVVSSDTTVVKAGTTNANGDALFSNLLAKGRTYVVRVSRAGYSSDASQQNPPLPTNGLVSVQFKLIGNSSSLTGRVVRSGTGSALGSAQVTTRRSTGEQYSVVTDASGAYAFKGIPNDNFVVIASKAGFRSDTLSVAVAAAENKAAPRDLSLVPTTVGIRGSVVYENVGVSNLTVTAVSASTVTTQTDASGGFVFTDLPALLNTDTTIYQITVVKDGLSPRSVKVVIPKTQVGQTLSLAPIILPSGRISFTVTDGLHPIEGVRVLFTPANGVSAESFTPVTGIFASGGTLEKGIQRFSLSKATYLSPGANALSIQLETDTTRKLSFSVLLPFRLATAAEITATDDAFISATARVKNNADVATLYYKKESGSSFTAVAMTRSNDTSFTGKIPAQFSTEKLSYYVGVKRDTIVYTSDVQTAAPSARGILSSIDFDPSLDHAVLRPADEYRISIVARDGANSAMGAKLLDPVKGKISWAYDSTALAITAKDTTALIRTKGKTGVYAVTATAILNNVSVSQSFSVTMANVVMKEITIGGLPAGGELNNAARGLQLTIGGRDTSGKSVNVGSSILWMLSPPSAGTISQRGLLSVDSTLLGKIVVTAKDGISNLSQNITISVVVTIDSSHAYYLTDKFAMELRIPKKAVNAPIDLQLADATFGPAKKFVFVKRTGQNFVASSNLYYLSYKGDALPGDSLKQTASLLLAEDASMKYYGGEKMMGLYDPIALEWTTLPAAPSTLTLGKQSGVMSTVFPGLQTDVLSHLKTQYTLLVLNQPLGLTHVAVLPNPFSPDVSPLKIGYIVSTTDQQALMWITIYNIRGELVRTLLDGERQYPGRYGSRSSSKEIVWDGKANDGSTARNGRYVIQLRAKDSTGEKVELIQVILIK